MAPRKTKDTVAAAPPEPRKSPSWPAHLGDVLFVKMRDKGWVQEDLAKHFGVAQSTIARWLDGSVHPNPKRVEEIARFCELDSSQAMRLNYKLGDPATELSTLSTRIAQIEADMASMSETITELRNQVRVGNELVAQLLDRVKSARQR